MPDFHLYAHAATRHIHTLYLVFQRHLIVIRHAGIAQPYPTEVLHLQEPAHPHIALTLRRWPTGIGMIILKQIRALIAIAIREEL